MTKELKDYQIDAIEGNVEKRRKGLFDYFKFYLDGGGSIVFKAPTGSGKTFVMSKLLEKISNEISDRNICYIWATIGKGDLYKQSYESVKNEVRGVPRCSLLTPQYLSGNSVIPDKEILFLNWEKIVQWDQKDGWKNSMMKIREGKNFIDLLEKTREAGTTIVLIIDESHIGKSNDTHIQKIQNEIINAKITFEVSATPKSKADVIVDEDDVADEGMIKQNLIVNKEIEIDTDGFDSSTVILEKAYNKRLEIKAKFEEIGSDVNPLCLIQIPNSEAGYDVEQVVEDFLREKDVTLGNGKLVKWMVDTPSFDKRGITKKNNPIEFMIFKTVVDTGWDCPRAHILVKFRDVKSKISLKQTIGRILRTPEAKKYDIPLLDNGYLFTNMEYIEPIDDIYNPNRVNDITVNIKKDENGIRLDDGLKLDSFYKSRAKAYNSADSRIASIIEEEFCNFFGISESDVLVDAILAEKGLKISGLDNTVMMGESSRTVKQIVTGTSLGSDGNNFQIESAENEMKAKYEAIITNNLNGLARARSLSPIKTSLSNTVKKHIAGVDRSNLLSFTQKLAIRNEEIIGPILSKATREFKKRFPDAQQTGQYQEFSIEEARNYASSTYEKIKSELSLYEEMYVLKQGTSQLEKDFVSFLDSNEIKIEWVWHNGSEPNINNFGVSYKDGTETFRPDFIISFKNGILGIFDTKAVNFQVEDTKYKAEGLHEYIIKEREANKNLVGGIVVFHNGLWYYNDNEEYKTILDAQEDWMTFDSLLR